MPDASPIDLGACALTPTGAPVTPLRADAARNRALLLEAAGRLVAERGAAGVTMEEVAAAAGVGKGTVFRRFGDRGGLLMALLDESARELQEAFIGGPPPLGPGAPPLERLLAFGRAVLQSSNHQLDLRLAAELDPERRYAHPSTSALTTHVTVLVRQLTPSADCDLLAHALMAYLDPALIRHLTRDRGMPLRRLEAGWADLVTRTTAAGGPEATGARESGGPRERTGANL
ncbi:TetR/AcrR family transcriptional regulator [Streptomyces sp. OUCMDZ-4982]|uniref:TetR/AcrR family transcriptional regulator n=1 Tax=Streptomyces sp. OUCMDZ-4982 TaxID=2973090 RepID=UPI00215CE567|nr:TetR/AcrR family transcriptional regulator [Streptomyces sp. OUCMDZ-4982]MCR8945141.1 TetR/AcrR family transcriptional regulator [Streptomyces sp. OUCMDZ-4982]